jgi:hypothetical protein
MENGPAIALEGDRNETVEAIQFLINCNQFADLTVDGVLGPASLAAIRDVQTAYGRESTGAMDDETFAQLSRGCTEDRRIDIGGEGAGQEIVVGNVVTDDPETYFMRVEEGRRIAVVVESETGAAVVSVRRVDGSTIGDARVTAWAEDVDETGDYVIEISTVGDAVTFTATVYAVDVEIDPPGSAPDGTIELDDFEEAVTEVCLDTNGNSSYVAETGPGYLVVTTDLVGTFAVERGGVGAPIEFIYKDNSSGYIGFATDFQIDVGDRIEGSGAVFLRGGDATEPFGLAFTFDRSAAPCEGGTGIPIVLSYDGLGVVDFGANDDETLGFVRSALPSASPTVDTGWIPIDPQNNAYGLCRSDTTEVRVIEVDNLTLYFTSASSSFAPVGTRHFVGYEAEGGVFPFVTGRAIGPGNTIADVLAAHPDAIAMDGVNGGVEVFITSPPLDDRWLRATAADASGPNDLDAAITSVSGGRFCDL